MRRITIATLIFKSVILLQMMIKKLGESEAEEMA